MFEMLPDTQLQNESYGSLCFGSHLLTMVLLYGIYFSMRRGHNHDCFWSLCVIRSIQLALH